MKKKYVGKIALLWITGAFLFASCEKKELMDYEGVDAIYFDVQYGASHGTKAFGRGKIIHTFLSERWKIR